jgi:hypothetical protein
VFVRCDKRKRPVTGTIGQSEHLPAPLPDWKDSSCRHYYKLAYASQRETGDDRAARRADRIRDRLGWEAGILNGDGDKPKGMHWRTFNRLRAEHNDFVNASPAGIMRKFGRLGVGLDDLLDDR